MAKKPAIPTTFCPYCNAKGIAQPCLSPMEYTFVEEGVSGGAQPYTSPHFKYRCPRCDHAELHDRLPAA